MAKEGHIYFASFISIVGNISCVTPRFPLECPETLPAVTSHSFTEVGMRLKSSQCLTLLQTLMLKLRAWACRDLGREAALETGLPYGAACPVRGEACGDARRGSGFRLPQQDVGASARASRQGC